MRKLHAKIRLEDELRNNLLAVRKSDDLIGAVVDVGHRSVGARDVIVALIREAGKDVLAEREPALDAPVRQGLDVELAPVLIGSEQPVVIEADGARPVVEKLVIDLGVNGRDIEVEVIELRRGGRPEPIVEKLMT